MVKGGNRPGRGEDLVITWIMALLIIVILLVISLVIVGNIQANDLVIILESGTVRNNSLGDTMVAGLALSNETFINYANTTIIALNDISCSLFNITNATTGTLIGAGNFTVGGVGNCGVRLLNGTISPDTYNSSNFNSTYSFNHNTFTGTDSLINNFTGGILTFGTFFNVLFTAVAIFAVLAVFLAVLLFLVVVTNKIRGRGGGSSGFGDGGL